MWGLYCDYSKFIQKNTHQHHVALMCVIAQWLFDDGG